MTRTLILGGARSGKSMHAEQLALASGKELIYIATAQAHDAEMAERIGLLSNLLFAEASDYPEVGRIDPPACFAEQRASFLQALEQAGGDIVLVSNEVGMGIVPQGAVSRWFVDESGRLHQAVGAVCERVTLVAAGLPLVLKG